MNGRDSYGVPAGLRESLASSPTALLQRGTAKRLNFSGYPPVGLLDAKNTYHAEEKGSRLLRPERRGLRSPGVKEDGLTHCADAAVTLAPGVVPFRWNWGQSDCRHSENTASTPGTFMDSPLAWDCNQRSFRQVGGLDEKARCRTPRRNRAQANGDDCALQ